MLHNGLEQLIFILAIKRRLGVEGDNTESVVGVSSMITQRMDKLLLFSQRLFLTDKSNVQHHRDPALVHLFFSSHLCPFCTLKMYKLRENCFPK